MTRTYDDIFADITTALTALSSRTGPDRDRTCVEQYERLSGLWAEVARMSHRDKLPTTSYLSARLLADRYAVDAREARREATRG